MKPKLADILKATLQVLGVEETEWKHNHKSRQSAIIRAKELFCLLAFEEGYLHADIGSFIDVHRTTAIHHINQFKAHCDIYPKCYKLIEEARTLIPRNSETMISHIGSAWLARGKGGILVISPTKLEDLNGYWIAPWAKTYNPQDAFPQVTYESGPVKVSIKVTINKDEEV